MDTSTPTVPTENELIGPAFHDAYARLAETGACDTPDGAEYRRVFDEWLAENRDLIPRIIRAGARLAELRGCDGPAAADEREFIEWILAGWPSDIEAFIRRRANLS